MNMKFYYIITYRPTTPVEGMHTLTDVTKEIEITAKDFQESLVELGTLAEENKWTLKEIRFSHFKTELETLTIGSFSNGTVELNGEERLSGEYQFTSNAKITLEAIPEEGYVFVKWSPSEETSNPITVIMDTDKEYTPVFESEE